MKLNFPPDVGTGLKPGCKAQFITSYLHLPGYFRSFHLVQNSFKMVRSVSDYQKPLAIRKIKRNKVGVSAVREVRNMKKNSDLSINKLPYKHLLREFSSDMKSLIKEEEVSRKSVKILHQASQAYLSGIFDGYTNVCQKVAKRESTSLLLFLASFGLNRVLASVAKDKDIARAARQSSHHFHHDHEHSEWNIPGLHHNHDHPQNLTFSEGSDDEDDAEEELGNNNRGDGASDIMTRIRSRISRNVTVTVLRD